MSYFILSMPGARSDWFARLVAGVSGLKYRDADFLNPLTCPEEHRSVLEGVFAGPALSLVGPFANPDHKGQRAVLSMTWEAQSEYELDKETWALTAMPALIAQGHSVVVFTRDQSLWFDDVSSTILAQYDLAWWTLKSHGKISGKGPESIRARVRVAHRWWINEAMRLCEEYSVPRITLESLIGYHPARLVSELVPLREWIPGLDIGALSEIIGNTREVLRWTEKRRLV